MIAYEMTWFFVLLFNGSKNININVNTVSYLDIMIKTTNLIAQTTQNTPLETTFCTPTIIKSKKQQIIRDLKKIIINHRNQVHVHK